MSIKIEAEEASRVFRSELVDLYIEADHVTDFQALSEMSEVDVDQLQRIVTRVRRPEDQIMKLFYILEALKLKIRVERKYEVSDSPSNIAEILKDL